MCNKNTNYIIKKNNAQNKIYSIYIHIEEFLLDVYTQQQEKKTRKCTLKIKIAKAAAKENIVDIRATL